MQVRRACRYIALLAVIPLAGCFTGRAVEQPIAAAEAAAIYHSANGVWPETRNELLAASSERLPLILRPKDQVWLRQNPDGSATVTTSISDWLGGSLTAYRVVPPSEPSTMPQDHAMWPFLGDYTFKGATPSKSFGRRLE